MNVHRRIGNHTWKITPSRTTRSGNVAGSVTLLLDGSNASCLFGKEKVNELNNIQKQVAMFNEMSVSLEEEL
jgi:hypothetical protein